MKSVRLVIFSIALLLTFSAYSQDFAYSRWAAYRSFIESELRRHELPLYYAYLPLLQTNCDIYHRNSYGCGAWALSMAVAHHYGLQILPGYDERHDMKRSSEAAVAYLADLYQHYHGNSEKVLQQFMVCTNQAVRSNKMSAEFLLRRIQEMCPTNMEFSTDSSQVDTITMAKSIYFRDFCHYVGIDSVVMMQCNPSILPKVKYLHASTKIYLPHSYKEQWAMVCDSVYSHAIETKKSQVTIPTTPPKPEPSYIVYRVRSGDTLGHIAMRYHVGVSQLKRWNRLQSDMLQIGQRLKIYR